LDPKPIGRNIPMTLHPPLEISVRESNGVYFVAVHGRLTIGDPSDHLNDQAVAMMKKGARNIIIDLNGIPQIDSSGISSLVRISIALAREGGALHLVCGQGRVRDALTVTRLVEAIPTFDSESAALACF
jgi:anti-anti-sigma factor